MTARLAAGYNRDVFALPGRTSDRYSAGCNALIADHVAGLVSSAADFASQMRWPTAETTPIQPSLFQELAPEEQAVIDLLTDRGEATLNDLTARIDIPTPKTHGHADRPRIQIAHPGHPRRTLPSPLTKPLLPGKRLYLIIINHLFPHT